MFDQAEDKDLSEWVNYISSVDTEKHMTYYRETPSTLLNSADYIAMWRIVLLNEIYLKIVKISLKMIKIHTAYPQRSQTILF